MPCKPGVPVAASALQQRCRSERCRRIDHRRAAVAAAAVGVLQLVATSVLASSSLRGAVLGKLRPARARHRSSFVVPSALESGNSREVRGSRAGISWHEQRHVTLGLLAVISVRGTATRAVHFLVDE